jgi:hypothetical protein
MEQSQHRRLCELGLVANAQLLPNPLHVGVDSVLADAETSRDLVMRIPAGYVLKYLFLPRRQDRLGPVFLLGFRLKSISRRLNCGSNSVHKRIRIRLLAYRSGSASFEIFLHGEIWRGCHYQHLAALDRIGYVTGCFRARSLKGVDVYQVDIGDERQLLIGSAPHSDDLDTVAWQQLR